MQLIDRPFLTQLKTFLSAPLAGDRQQLWSCFGFSFRKKYIFYFSELLGFGELLFCLASSSAGVSGSADTEIKRQVVFVCLWTISLCCIVLIVLRLSSKRHTMALSFFGNVTCSIFSACDSTNLSQPLFINFVILQSTQSAELARMAAKNLMVWLADCPGHGT